VIRTGDVLHNPVTGELMRFVKAAHDTNGEYVVVDVTVEPNGTVAAAHLHPYQTETFRVLDGEVTFKVGREKVVAKTDTTLVVKPGTAHKFWNSGVVDARFRCEIRPALQFEQLIETMFTLAQEGKTNKKGMPNPFRLAVIANAHFDDVRLPLVPQALQKLALAMGAPVGRLLGYRAVNEVAQQTTAELAAAA
jgi:mannose-6-phosphate isomerase-like protein (cupin superfamily)